MRFFFTAAMLLLAACSQQEAPRLSNAAPGINIAHAALASGSPEIALNVSNGILAREPRNVPALISQGDALSTLGRLEEAEASYAKAVNLNAGSIEGQIGLGRLRLRFDPAQAEALFLDVLQREPRNKIALNNLGIAYDLQGDHATAQAVYRRLLGTDPTLRSTEVNLALSMALSGRAPEAVHMLRPLAARLDAMPRTRHDFAVALVMAGQRDEAARVMAKDMTPDQLEQALQGFGALGP
jgi:Flp pilus assembly protein TadD